MKNIKDPNHDQVIGRSVEHLTTAEENDGKCSFSEFRDDEDAETFSLLEFKDRSGSKSAQVPETTITSHATLIGVDVQRVSMFCGENALLLGGVVKMILGVWFLVYLIGWIRLVTVQIPFHSYMPKLTIR
tara:strand:- start:713 stop:1102 length:390 start_codon:yes stop_codon:yes gene_type:complete